MSLQRQHFLLSYFKTLSVGPAEVWTRATSLAQQNGARLLQRTEFILDKLIDHFHSRGQQLCTVLGSLYASGKLPTYPSPEPTLTLTSHLGQNFQFNSHRTFLLHQYRCRFIGFTPTWPLCTWHHVKRCFEMYTGGNILTKASCSLQSQLKDNYSYNLKYCFW